MNISFGSAAGPAAFHPGRTAPASLQAQLEKYRHQLSDCVNCASANTDKGKADIAALRARIGSIEARLSNPDTDDTASAPARVADAGQPGALIDTFV